MSEQEEKKEVPEEKPGEGAPEAEAASAAGAAPGDPAAELAAATEKIRELEDRILRMAAEQENFKKRMQRERETSLKYAEENILRELLPSIDNLERALGHGDDTDASALRAGVEMTCKGLVNTLEKFGLKSLDGVGQPFDPNFHDALATEHSDDVPENMILQEFQKGYMFKDRLIRAAKVVVSKGKASE
ncbi:nucleotide exchange factor GrpE [Thiovibrio sp. JS02]